MIGFDRSRLNSAITVYVSICVLKYVSYFSIIYIYIIFYISLTYNL